MPANKKRSRKVKFYKTDFKIPSSTHVRLKGFCKKNNTTPNKVFRRALREFLERNYLYHDHHEDMVSPNQMSIFDLIEETTKKARQ